MLKLFIGGLSPATDEIELAKLLLSFGKINTIQIVRDKFTGKPKGFAFVEMQNDEDAKNAISELNGQSWHDNNIIVKIQEDQPRKPQARPYPPKRPFNTSSYVKTERKEDSAKPKRPRRTN